MAAHNLVSPGKEAREQIKIGIDIVANAVKVTLGPNGRNVLIHKMQGMLPDITKDGVTVAKSIRVLDNALQDAGAQMIKGVAGRTAGQAGDGTTTATLLTQVMITDGMLAIDNGANPMDLKRGMDKAVSAVVEHIKKQAQPVGENISMIEHIATISANNDTEIGAIIAEAVSKVGNDGLITMEDSKTAETFIKVLEGLQIDKGWINANFVTDKSNMTAVYENPLIHIYDKKISLLSEILSIMEYSKRVNRPLVFICDDMDNEALSTLCTNVLRGSFPVVAIKSPGFGATKREFLNDIATITGGQVISEESGQKINVVNAEAFGQCSKITVMRNSTIIVGGKGSEKQIKDRAEQIRTQLQEAKGSFEERMLSKRLATLTNGVAVLYVGANSELELKQKKDRIEDALCATRAAIEEGIVAGGGTAYIKAINVLDKLSGLSKDEEIGVVIIGDALLCPFAQIGINSGLSHLQNKENFDFVDEKKEWQMGFNAKTGKIENLIESGVIDPAKVCRVALENAVSVASMFLTTEGAITENQ